MAELVGVDHRRGAATVTGGLMLLVYALSRAPEHGWSAPSTLGLLAASLVALAAFVGIELRSPSPLLPMRIFRLRSLSAANGAMALIGAALFSEFFVLTLYLENVLGYSAVESGAAFTGFAGTVVVVSNLSQPIVGRLGVRRSLVLGILLSIASVAALTRLPVDGHYWDLFPWFVVGGAIGIASTSAVIAGAGGLDAGLRNAMYVLLGLLIAAAFLVATAMRPRPAAGQEPVADAVPLREAA